MGCLQKLYETYEHNLQMLGTTASGTEALTPVSHMLSKAQIEITITKDGCFVSASKVEKENNTTLIPCTEASAGRASGAAPHPLCDTLSYVAGDYCTYIHGLAKIKKAKEKHEKYMDMLKKWVEWPEAHKKVKAIYNYCIKETITKDLIEYGVLKLDDQGILAEEKIAGNEYEKCLIRWLIIDEEDLSAPRGTWEDQSLFKNYSNYVSETNQDGRKDICYISGKKGVAAVQHPKAIIGSAGNAKLISANDNTNFTFRGRFIDSDEACAISYEVSQKAHSALKWLVKEQGLSYSGRVTICWNPCGKKVMEPDETDYGDNDADTDDDDAAAVEAIPNTMPGYKRKLQNLIQGYKENYSINDDVLVMTMDAATTGRLSIIYYNQFKSSDYFDRIMWWRESCCWYFTKFGPDKKPYQAIETPSIQRIIERAFGTEQGSFIKVDDRIMKQQSQRIMNCILERQQVPNDIIHQIVIKASNPLAYKSNDSGRRPNHERVLRTACALLRKRELDRVLLNQHSVITEEERNNKINEMEETLMQLNENETDRSYIFGRLLAVMEYTERSAYSEEDKKGRETNAVRYWSAFQNHPFHTWRILTEQINPYLKHSKDGGTYFKKITAELLGKIKDEDLAKMDQTLGDKYLLGYYLQNAALYAPKQDTDKTTTETKLEEDK